MLEHADRRDSVVRAVCDIPVVREPDLDPIGDTSLQHACAREPGLAARDGDADPRDAVTLGRVDEHAAPPAADVEEAHPLAQPELLGNELVLRLLRLLERCRRVGEKAQEYVIEGPSTRR